MQNVVLGIMTMGGQVVFMLEFNLYEFFIKQLCDEKFLPYKLIRDATYLM
jgi:uncharacterized membrane protein YqhA